MLFCAMSRGMTMKKAFAIILACMCCVLGLVGCGKARSADAVYLNSSYCNKIEFAVKASGYSFEESSVCCYSSAKDEEGVLTELENNNCKRIIYDDYTYYIKLDAMALFSVEIEEGNSKKSNSIVTLYDEPCAIVDREKDDTNNGMYIEWYFPFPFFMVEGVWELSRYGRSCKMIYCDQEYKVKDVDQLMSYLDEFEIFDLESTGQEDATIVTVALKDGSKTINLTLRGDTIVFSRDE